MKITRKEVKFTEDMLNDMYAEKLLEKYYTRACVSGPIEAFLSLAVWVDKNTGIDYLYDISALDNYEDCKQDYKVNRDIFNKRNNCYNIFITGKRIEFLKDKPIYLVIESEAIER